jgi:hypothetical protein
MLAVTGPQKPGWSKITGEDIFSLEWMVAVGGGGSLQVSYAEEESRAAKRVGVRREDTARVFVCRGRE